MKHFEPPRGRMTDDRIASLARKARNASKRRDVIWAAYRDTDLDRVLGWKEKRQSIVRRVASQVGSAGLRIMWPTFHPVAVSLAVSVAGVTALLALPGILEPVVRPVLASVKSESVDEVMAQMTCGNAVLLSGADGTLVDVVRRTPGPDCVATHLTTPFDDATALRIADAIGVLEGRWSGPQTLLTVDTSRLALAAANMMELRFRGLTRSDALAARNRGAPATFLPIAGSGPVLSAFEVLANRPGEQTDIGAKLEAVLGTMILAARLMPDDLDRAHFLAERMPVILDRGARPLAGAAGAMVLFGGAPESLAQVCLFAASTGFPLYQPGGGDSLGWERAVDVRLSRAKARARVCVGHLATDPVEQAGAVAEIASFALPESPLPGSANGIIAVQDAIRADFFPVAAPISVLTLDMNAQPRSARALTRTLAGLEERLAPGLCFDGACEIQADYLVAVAEITGADLPLRVVHTNRHDSLFGPFSHDSGVPQAIAPAFGLASQHKIPLVLIAARADETRLCNRFIGDIANTTGPTPVERCTDDATTGWIDIEDAIAVSMNLPFVDLAARHADEAAALEDKLGFLGMSAGPAGVALGFGRAAPPERFMSLMAAIDRGSREGDPRTMGLSITTEQTPWAVDLEDAGFDATTAALAADYLQAPMRPEGTLRTLPGVLATVGCAPFIGKTGSPETEAGLARSRTATFTVSCGMRRFVVFAGLWSSHGNRALGDIQSADLGALAADALGAILKP